MEIINMIGEDNSLFQSIKDCADPVVSTLGPGGSTVMLRHADGSVDATQDGVTVLRHLVYASRGDAWLNAGAKVLENAAKQVVERVGDGTTSTTLLLSYISSMIESGVSGQEINKIVEELALDYESGGDGFYEGVVRSIDDDLFANLFRISKVSTHGDNHLSETVARCCEHVGKYGIVNVMKSDVPGVSYILEDGYTIPSGMQLPNYQNKPGVFEAKNVAVLIVGDVIDDGETIWKVLDMYRRWERKEGYGGLVIIGGGLAGSGAGGLVENLKNNPNRSPDVYGVSACAVQFPEGSDDRILLMQDLCSVVGQSKLFIKSLGVTIEQAYQKMEDVNPFGVLSEVSITKGKSTLRFSDGDAVKRYCESLEDSIVNDDEDLIRRRIARLLAGVAYIVVGAQDDIERGRLYDLVEDSVLACMSSMRDGVCVGMGKFHLLMANRFNELVMAGVFKSGYSEHSINAVMTLLECVTKKVFINANLDLDLISGEMSNDKAIIVDFRDRTLKDGWSIGVIEPVMAPLLSLRVAASVGSNLGRTEYFINYE
jgi:chaperonin GroEL (HSP60 family)